MLGFFRKYQKFFLIVVSFFIIVSFVFFGTSNALSRTEKDPNWEVGHLVDGSVLMSKKLHGMTRLLQGGVEEGSRGMNLLNGSLVHKEIILGAQGEILAQNYFEELYPELSERWKRMKQYSPYAHPYTSAISAKAVWNQFAPEITQLLHQVREAPEEFSIEELPLMFALYRAQAKFPPHMLHQMLYFQERHGGQVRPDPALPRGDFALFGFGSVEDWFGTKYLSLISQFVLNTACIAKQEGYRVSSKEAQFNLYMNVEQGLKSYQNGQELTSEEVHKYYSYGIRSLGMQEKRAVTLWQEALLYRAFVNELKGAVVVDRLALDQFKKEAQTTYSIRNFQLPQSLRLSSFQEMLTLQCYLDAVAEKDVLAFPPRMKSPEEVAKLNPQLVAESLNVKLAKVTKKEVAARVPLKKGWEWELEEDNFALLVKEFPTLAGKTSDSHQARIEALEQIDERTRFQVDQFARLAIVDQNQRLIEEALAKAPLSNETLQVALKGEGPFAGEQLIHLLKTRDPSLLCYTTDGETYYQMEMVSSSDGLELLSYEEALSKGILGEMLDQLLAAAYPNFAFEEPLEEVKDQLGAKIYQDLLSYIQQSSGESFEELDKYASHRFDGYLQEMRELAKANPDEFSKSQSSPKDFWALQVFEESQKELKAPLQVGEFSQIAGGGFIQLLEKTEGAATEEEIAEVHQFLAEDAEKMWISQMIEHLNESSAVSFHE